MDDMETCNPGTLSRRLIQIGCPHGFDIVGSDHGRRGRRASDGLRAAGGNTDRGFVAIGKRQIFFGGLRGSSRSDPGQRQKCAERSYDSMFA